MDVRAEERAPVAAGAAAVAPHAPASPEGASRKVFIKTYGCQMNVYDSQRMGDALAVVGYEPTDVIEDADLVLLNTCHIRERAAEKVYSELGRIRLLKMERESAGLRMDVAVAGCVAQAEGREILDRAAVVDLVIGPQTYHRLPEALARVAGGERVVDTDYAVEDKFAHLPDAAPREIRARGVTAFLTVQEGCDKFCTFCVVPYTRGAEVSRPAAQILAEARRLAASGVREITLLGQNVNAWAGELGGRPVGLGALLRALAEIPGVARLRYTTSHPRDMDDDLIAAHRDLAALMPYLHLPVQSGSDRILKAMNRRHTAADYLRLLDRIRAARPDIALSGDFIVGFPGESEADFEATLDLVRAVGYASAFSFKYSARPGTPGASMPDHVPDAVTAERLERLQAVLRAQTLAFMGSLVGRRVEVLVEKPGRYAHQRVGRSPYLQPVVLPAAAGAVGDVVTVRIARLMGNSLFAEGAVPAEEIRPIRRPEAGAPPRSAPLAGRLAGDAGMKAVRGTAPASGASDMAHIVLTFEDNRLAGSLFGRFDEHLALIEQKLKVDARARGNKVEIRGDPVASEQARRTLDYLYGRLQSGGGELQPSDVEGAIRMAIAQDDQLVLPTLEKKGRLSLAQISTRKKTIHARTSTQDAYMRALDRSELVLGIGPAGTGKTYLAVAHAAQLLERGQVDRIVLSRPAVEAGERLGFLPGDLKEKVDPYLRPLYDALYDMIPAEKVERALAAGAIEVAPLAFMRGRTLANCCVILDEAQNTTSMQMKMFLTRLGENARMVVTGDPSQIDLPPGQKSGLVEALRVLSGIPNVVTVRFEAKDVVRHHLVQAIVEAYEADAEKNRVPALPGERS